MLELREVSKVYNLNGQEIRALDGVSLSFSAGEFTAIRGPSGSGKTTLLNMIGLLDLPTSGDLLLDGVSLSSIGSRERVRVRRRKLGFIFQNYNLIPELNVLENVEMPLNILRMPRAEKAALTSRIVEDVGLTKYAKHRPGELSGGQQQRVAIARALVKKPPLVVADEPTANLDSKNGTAIMELMSELNEKYGVSFIFATHDEKLLPYMKRVLYIEDGAITREA